MSEKMIFCLGEGRGTSKGDGYQKNLQIFNTPVSEAEFNKAKNALDIKDFKLPIAKWVEKKNMTKDEKDSWPSHKETGGYLKELGYKEAWKEVWSTLSQSDKAFLKELPHFNSEIFEKITGIEVEDEISLAGKVVEVKLDGKSYKAIIQ